MSMKCSSRTWIPVLGLTVLCVGSDRVAAVTQVEVKQWPPPDFLPLVLQFDALVTRTDLAEGVLFSLQERDPGGNDLILNLAIPWTAPYPAVGTEIRVRADLYVTCGPTGLSGDSNFQWHVTWCDLALGTQVRFGGPTPARAVGASEFESAYEFVIADENGVEGANPSPEDGLSCGVTHMPPPSRVVPNPYDLARAGLPIVTETDASAFSRTDPELASEFAGTIGLYFDVMGQIACGDIPPSSSAPLYVVAHTAGPTRCGITGAELLLDALPAGWVADVTVPPGAILIGNPLTSPGCNIAFAPCRPGGSGSVLLCTIGVFATSAVSDHVIKVVSRNPPLNFNFACPLVTLCDFPNYSIVCTSGLETRINPPPGSKCDIPIAVEARTWSGVKRLYE